MEGGGGGGGGERACNSIGEGEGEREGGVTVSFIGASTPLYLPPTV